MENHRSLPRSRDVFDIYNPIPSAKASHPKDLGHSADFDYSNANLGNTTVCEDYAAINRENLPPTHAFRAPTIDLERQASRRTQKTVKQGAWPDGDKRTFLITLGCTTAFTAAIIAAMMIVGYVNRGSFRLDRPYIPHGP